MYFCAPNSSNNNKIAQSTQILVIFLQYFNQIRTFFKKIQAILKRNSSKFWKNSTRNSKNSSKMSTRCSTVLRISVKKTPLNYCWINLLEKVGRDRPFDPFKLCNQNRGMARAKGSNDIIPKSATSGSLCPTLPILI